MSFDVRKFVPGFSIPHVAPIISGTKNSLPPGVSREQHEAARRELDHLLTNLIGKVNEPNEYAKASINSDRLMALLHESSDTRIRMMDQFLRARHGSPRESFRMISNTLKWRSSLDLASYVSESNSILAHPAARFPMTVCSSSEKCTQPVVYGLMRILDKRKVERTPFSQAIISFFETLFFKENYISEEMIVILDFRGWSLRKHAPIRSVKDGLNTLQSYYPDRLNRVFLVNYPASIKAAYTGKDFSVGLRYFSLTIFLHACFLISNKPCHRLGG